jgi:predicted signal transduction protein with EAL and GGDEF domain
MVAQFELDLENIKHINDQIIHLFNGEDYIALNAMLVKRLELLKALDEQVNNGSVNREQSGKYYRLLEEILADDKQQVSKVKALQKELQASTLKIDRGRTAVNAYKNTFTG